MHFYSPNHKAVLKQGLLEFTLYGIGFVKFEESIGLVRVG